MAVNRKSKRDPRLARAGVSGFNKPKRTPNHPKKSHVVVAKSGGKIKTIRFGQQGAKTAGKPKAGESRRTRMKRKSFKARHRKNIAKGPMSAAYWANKVKWQENTMEVSKDSKFTLSLETGVSILVTVGMVIGMWFTLQADIEEAKELPVPEVGRTEYDLKDQMIRNTIIETQKDVTEMKEEQKEMRDDVKNIERMMMQQN